MLDFKWQGRLGRVRLLQIMASKAMGHAACSKISRLRNRMNHFIDEPATSVTRYSASHFDISAFYILSD